MGGMGLQVATALLLVHKSSSFLKIDMEKIPGAFEVQKVPKSQKYVKTGVSCFTELYTK
jgi:hypothetical protein